MDELINGLVPPDAGVQCLLHPVFGASLYTTRAFDVGEIVWQEEVALVSGGTSLLNYAKVLKGHDAADLARILAGFMALTPAELKDNPTFAMIDRLCGAFRKSHAAQLPLVTQLVSAFEINGHGLPNDKAGLFTVASKAAHSCSPNVVYKLRSDTAMSYVAIKPIAAHSLVYYSYIAGGKLGYPAVYRQALLTKSYYFTCGCGRCAGVDDVRPLKCPACSSDILYTAATSLWSCSSCDTTLTDDAAASQLPLKQEEDLETIVFGMDTDPDSAPVEKVRAAYALATETLSMNHWTVVYLSRILVEMSMPPSTDFMAPALTAPQVASTAKRIARWCADVLARHNAVSAAGLVFTYRRVLFAQSAADSEVRADLAALYPFFRLNYGPHDADVVAWRRVVWTAELQELDTRQCGHCTKPATLRCSRCAAVAYCAKACQVVDWKLHKRVCPTLKTQQG